MSARSAARRYAAVLFDVVNTSGDVVRADADLRGFVDMVHAHADLKTALTSPAIPPARKQAIVAALVAAAGSVTVEVARLLNMLAERDRLGSLDDVAQAFTARVMAHRKIVDARITTAHPLPDTQRDAIASALSAASGATVRVKEEINPEIVGGVIATVGNTVYDGSVARQLDKMRQQLLAHV